MAASVFTDHASENMQTKLVTHDATLLLWDFQANRVTTFLAKAFFFYYVGRLIGFASILLSNTSFM
jgi:hypothetical protein